MSGCCSQSARPLLWKTLFRVIAFSVLAASGGLIFAAVEHPNAVNNLKRKEELLVSLREGMAKKYNMSQDDFDNFIEITDDAFNMDGPSWSYFQSVRFAFETLTTIGKPNLECFTKKKCYLMLSVIMAGHDSIFRVLASASFPGYLIFSPLSLREGGKMRDPGKGGCSRTFLPLTRKQLLEYRLNE